MGDRLFRGINYCYRLPGSTSPSPTRLPMRDGAGLCGDSPPAIGRITTWPTPPPIPHTLPSHAIHPKTRHPSYDGGYLNPTQENGGPVSLELDRGSGAMPSYTPLIAMGATAVHLANSPNGHSAAVLRRRACCPNGAAAPSWFRRESVVSSARAF